ncbi:MAG TPA: NifU family protein [Solirubrobacterales bacterium]|nr:NifU family protein [Solirubrobacterales bacterium]
MDDQQTRARVERVELLLEQVEALPDAHARDVATELVQGLLDLYGEGFARIAAQVDDPAALTGDELVSHLLLLHGIHPVPLETRVRGALAEVRPYLESHGGNVELVSVEDGVVLLRMEGSCSGCPSSAMTLKLAIEDAIHKAAPDVASIEAEGAPAPAPSAGLIELAPPSGVSAELPMAPAAALNGGPDESAWVTVGQLRELTEGGMVVKQVAGAPVLFLRLMDTPYAYRPDCPACGHSLQDAELRAAELRCPGCGNRYDAIRAGRCLDDREIALEPVPLLVADSGLVKVALPAAAV